MTGNTLLPTKGLRLTMGRDKNVLRDMVLITFLLAVASDGPVLPMSRCKVDMQRILMK